MVRSRIVGVGGRTLPHGPREAPESYAPGLLVLPAVLGRHSLMANRQINFDVLVCDANHVRDYQLTGHGADSPIRSKMTISDMDTLDDSGRRSHGPRQSIGRHSGIYSFRAQFQTDGEGALFCFDLIIFCEVLRITN